MKKLFFLLITFLSSFIANSQSISIEPNSLQLPQLATNPTCTVADKGKMIFNTTDNKLLYCNGTAWIAPTATTAPQVFGVASTIAAILSPGINIPPWTLAGAATPTITVVNGQSITGNFAAVLGHNNTNTTVAANVSVCIQQMVGGVPTGSIYPFFTNNFPEATILAAPTKTMVSASGAVMVVTGATLGVSNTIPPGSYRVMLGVRNKSTTINLGSNDFMFGNVVVY
jgi:hypothetical protein